MTVVLVLALALAAWVLSLYLRPFGPCHRCHGKRILMRCTSKKPRPVTCPRCSGAGRCQRPGSKTVHQLARRVRRYQARQRQQRAATLTTTPKK